MTRLIRSEFRKVRTIPTMWWLLLGVVVLISVGTMLGFVVADLQDLVLNEGEGLKWGLHTAGIGSTLAEIAAIIGMAGEFRFGQATQTFLSEPRRARVVVSKIVVYGLTGLAFGLAAAAVALATAWIWLTGKGIGLPFDQDLLWQILASGIASAGLFALLGVAVGAALRNQVTAIVTVLAVQLFLETSIFQASKDAGRWLPGLAGNALRRFPDEGLLAPATAALTLALWIAGILAIGFARTLRRDITTA